MKLLDTILTKPDDFLKFLKTRFSLFHLSNLFFRDVQYGIMSFAESLGSRVSYAEAEDLARAVIGSMEHSGVLKAVKPGSWMLNYPAFQTPSAKPHEPAKSSAVPVPKPAQVGATPATAAQSQIS